MIEFEEMGENKKASFIFKDPEINLTHPESQHMFRRLVERGMDGIFMADVRGTLFYVNHAFVLMLGHERKEDILGTNLADGLFKDREHRGEFLKKMNDTGSVRDFEIKLVRKDGLNAVLSITGNSLENDRGEMIGIDGIARDVTERNILEQALRTEKQKMGQILELDEVLGSIHQLEELAQCVVERTATILDAQKCSLMLLDDHGKVLSIAGAKGLSHEVIKEAKVGWGEMISGAVARDGRPLLVQNIEYDRKYRRGNRASYLGRSFMIAPVRMGHKIVGVINVADKVVRPDTAKGSRIHSEEAFNNLDLRILTTIAREVSVSYENVKLYSELSSLAVTDPLTHIYNYRQFSKSLDYEFKRCRRSNAPLCIMMIDLDDLKTYNDTFGHQEGDALLRHLAQIFKDQLREVDIVCRYAGDEFAIILPDTGVDGASLAARKIQEATARFSFKRTVTLSFGIAEFTSGMTQYQLILNADKALYQAKQQGKNGVRVFEGE